MIFSAARSIIYCATSKGKRCFLAKESEAADAVLYALRRARELEYKKNNLLSNVQEVINAINRVVVGQ